MLLLPQGGNCLYMQDWARLSKTGTWSSKLIKKGHLKVVHWRLIGDSLVSQKWLVPPNLHEWPFQEAPSRLGTGSSCSSASKGQSVWTFWKYIPSTSYRNSTSRMLLKFHVGYVFLLNSIPFSKTLHSPQFTSFGIISSIHTPKFLGILLLF